MSDNRQKIATLKREFGNHLCDDVLEAVLGFNNGDVIAAGNFLRADAENPAFQQEQDAQGEYLPQNYRQRMQAITPGEVAEMKKKLENEMSIEQRNKFKGGDVMDCGFVKVESSSEIERMQMALDGVSISGQPAA
eukprot:Colp12_sorted_trinity150504_noHs@8181